MTPRARVGHAGEVRGARGLGFALAGGLGLAGGLASLGVLALGCPAPGPGASMLDDLATHVMLPAHEDLVTASVELEATTKALCATPSANLRAMFPVERMPQRSLFMFDVFSFVSASINWQK